jgi:hypothetical protein
MGPPGCRFEAFSPLSSKPFQYMTSRNPRICPLPAGCKSIVIYSRDWPSVLHDRAHHPINIGPPSQLYCLCRACQAATRGPRSAAARGGCQSRMGLGSALWFSFTVCLSMAGQPRSSERYNSGVETRRIRSRRSARRLSSAGTWAPLKPWPIIGSLAYTRLTLIQPNRDITCRTGNPDGNYRHHRTLFLLAKKGIQRF